MKLYRVCLLSLLLHSSHGGRCESQYVNKSMQVVPQFISGCKFPANSVRRARERWSPYTSRLRSPVARAMWKRWTEVVTGIRERSGKSGTLVLLQKLLRVLPMTEELTEPPVKRQCTDGPLTRGECASTLAVSREGSSGDLLTPTEPTLEEPVPHNAVFLINTYVHEGVKLMNSVSVAVSED